MTGYFQRISKDRLKTVMAMEADRMLNLKLDEKEVATEREVILEERRSRTENNPSNILSEQMSAALYQNHPYRIPIIGWMHEMAKLSREDALAFYKRHYAPNNAIVVVAGDVTVEEVKALAEATYGPLKPNPEIKARKRPQEPPHRSPRRVELKDPRAGNASVRRFYLAPGVTNAAEGEAEALYLLTKVAFNGTTSRLYQRLVSEEKLASSAGGWYSGQDLDSGSIGIYAVAAQDVPLDKLEAGIDKRPARAARRRRHRRRARARQEGLHRRFHLRVRQPERARPPLRPGHAARPHHRAGQRLARRHLQGHRRGREARRRQALRHPPLGHRLADPHRTGLRRCRESGRRQVLKEGHAMTPLRLDRSRRQGGARRPPRRRSSAVPYLRARPRP